MASRITDYAEGTTIDPQADWFIFVDSSDTTMDPTGTTKKAKTVNFVPVAKVTSADFPSTGTTLTDITGLSVALQSGKTYRFIAEIAVTLDASGGGKLAVQYSGTTSYFIATGEVLGQSVAFTGSVSQTTTPGSAVVNGTATGATMLRATGTITTTSTGNLTVQFAEHTATGTSHALQGSALDVTAAS